jgi:glycosyltransferase involved in cell wall biosynthesis
VQLPSVAVVVPTYRRPDSLAACLAALAGQTTAPTEVVVVIRNGDDPSTEVVDSFRERLHLRTATVATGGQVAALNAGLASTRSEIVAFTDDDCRPTAGWVERIADRFAADASLGALGGRDVVHEGEPRQRVVGSASRVGCVTWFGRPVGFHHFDAPAQEVHFLKGANMAIRRETLSGFDTRLRGAGAQVCNDMCATLAVGARGWTVAWDPAVEVDHYPAQRFDADQRLGRPLSAIADESHNEIYALGRWAPLARRPSAIAYALLVGRGGAPGLLTWPLFAARTRALHPVLAATFHAIRGRLAGLATLTRSLRREP